MNYTFERKINYYETDRMGVVHHSNYIRFLEEARCEMMAFYNIPYDKMEDLGVMIPVLGVKCNYKHHVTFGDTILIECQVKEFNGVRMTVSYNVTNKETGDLVITAETNHCFTTTALRPCNLKKHYLEAYNILMDMKK